jgi:hypothetical protein
MREAWETEEKGGGSLREIEGKGERWGRQWNWHKRRKRLGVR